ncbi:hypothetical protein FIBSPDRAFT_932164 [Athelia psychrophila]|uniref:Uncharacterized protein n=1 Tax=Athelia psychrophila TaxID=1759441 RepID=A0A166JCK3_9AGAM|nr:hypothetical protein FIBSPDRAFT_932164 [Fibularhizoctonia sp. CBS 109695]
MRNMNAIQFLGTCSSLRVLVAKNAGGPVWKPVVFTIVGVVGIVAVLALGRMGRRSHISRPDKVVSEVYFRNSYERREASLQINKARFAQEWQQESADFAEARALAGEPPIDDGASFLAAYTKAAERTNQRYIDVQLGLPKDPPIVACSHV